MPKKLYEDVPDGYPVCLHGDCPLAEDCLHRLAYHVLIGQSDILRVVNPNHCVKDQSCPYFRSAVPVRCACGFTAMQQNMLPGQYRTFMAILVERFGRNSYYERRRGGHPSFAAGARRRAGCLARGRGCRKRWISTGTRRRCVGTNRIVLCGEHLSTLRQVLEYFPQSTKS